jgi:hypothetical protein
MAWRCASNAQAGNWARAALRRAPSSLVMDHSSGGRVPSGCSLALEDTALSRVARPASGYGLETVGRDAQSTPGGHTAGRGWQARRTRNWFCAAFSSDAGSRHEPADGQTASNSSRRGDEDGCEEEGHAAPVGAG